jgi:hypothetical protein
MRKKSCPVCQGTKKYRDYGMMTVDCAHCDATGFVELDKFVCDICKKEIMVDAASSILDAQEPKKRARRSKIVSEEIKDNVSNDGS